MCPGPLGGGGVNLLLSAHCLQKKGNNLQSLIVRESFYNSVKTFRKTLFALIFARISSKGK
jgi:hypothetical protein